LRVDAGEQQDVMIFGGQDHRTGQCDDTERCYEELSRELAETVPHARAGRRWSGQVMETPDGLPYIGWAADHQFIGTGYSGNGITFGTVCGIMARDAIMGHGNPWTDLLSPQRKKLSAAWDYAKENADYPYYLAKDKLALGEAGGLDAVPRNEGRVLRVDGKRIAAYRDEQGNVTKLSAICPHLGCVVQWNKAERTWDCPCHGSRFASDGAVIAGPAQKGLRR
jgi:Rieske Fe-S protein